MQRQLEQHVLAAQPLLLETRLLRAVPYLPLLWTALSVLSLLLRALLRILGSSRRPEERARGLFSTFIQTSDILDVLGAARAGEPEGGLGKGDTLFNRSLVWLSMLGASVALSSGVILSATTRGTWTEVLRSGKMVLAGVGLLAWSYAALTTSLRRSVLPAYSLLTLALLCLAISTIELTQAMHAWRFPLLVVPQVLTLLTSLAIVVRILRTPLRPRLPDGYSLRPSSKGIARTAPPSPEDTNTLWGSLSYAWMGDMMVEKQEGAMELEDVFVLSMDNRASVLWKRFSSLTERTLLGRILHASASDFAIDFTLKLLAVSFDFCRPLLLQRLLECLTRADSALGVQGGGWTERDKAYVFGVLAAGSMALRSLAELQHFHHARRIGMRLKTELVLACFDKVLRKKSGAASGGVGEGGGRKALEEGASGQTNASVGKVVNLVSKDTDQILRQGCDSHLAYGCPLQITLGLLLLYRLLGASAFPGLAVFLFAIPINYLLGKQSICITRGRSLARDARLSTTQELSGAIRTIKLFGWSTIWVRKVQGARDEELRWLIKEWQNRFFLTLLWSTAAFLVPFLSFYSFTVLKSETLTVPIAFTALSLFTMLRQPLVEIPAFAIRVLQTLVSVKRIEEFLAEEEVPELAQAQGNGIGFEKASFAREDGWILGPLDVTFPEGRLTVISGPTASGKSSLLLALLGELEPLEGLVHRPRVVGYCAQPPWLESASIRSNILYGAAFSPSRYAAVLEGCSLVPDLEVISDGEEVGLRGVNLSGGQRARIALARAVYSSAQTLVFDDVLSAVDVHTAKRLVAMLRGELCRGRTLILVTHHADLALEGGGCLIEMDGGSIIRQGDVPSREAREHDDDAKDKGTTLLSAGPFEGEANLFQSTTISPEQRASGSVKWHTIMTYLNACSLVFWGVLLGFVVTKPVLSFAEAYWLRLWGEAAAQNGTVDVAFYLKGYLLIGLITVASLLLSTILLYMTSLRASRSLFSRLLDAVVNATPHWHDSTAPGRVISRFTQDLATVDEALATNFYAFASSGAALVFALLTNVLLVPLALVPTGGLVWVYLRGLFLPFLAASRELNRISSTTTAPIFSGFAEVLEGITTIRAFGSQESYRRALFILMDQSQGLWYCGCTMAVWLSIRTQVLSAACVLGTALLAVRSGLDAGFVGIVLAFSQLIVMSLDSLCLSYSRIVLDMNSIERLQDFFAIPQEVASGNDPPAHWPSALPLGTAMITVEDLVVRYADELPEVLKGLSFTVRKGERVAIVGATGSGKSTLALSLLRFMDTSSGRILVDGLDISRIRLEQLRSRVTMIPQDAILFDGTIRDNLDPGGNYSEEECHSALRRVQSSTSTDLLLTTLVSRSSLSAGQQQLVALARAILRDSRIIIFDEATSSVDFELDNVLQGVIRESGATTLTIAHRLRTVFDYDRILVLDRGSIAEYDSPLALLQKGKGPFYQMVHDSGDLDLALSVARARSKVL